MSTWKMPEELGSVELESATDEGHVVGFRVGGYVIRIPRVLLTEVKPPLPPEPPLYTAVLVRWPNTEDTIFRRYLSGWAEPGFDPSHIDHDFQTWAQVNERGTPVRLVPAPPPVELPWEWRAMQVKVTSPPTRVFMRVVAYHSYFEPDDADALAAALVAAAAEVRAEASDVG